MLEEMVDMLNAYVQGDLPLELIDHWVKANLDSLLEMGDWDATLLVDEIDASLADLDNGRLTENDFKEGLREKLAMLKGA